VISAATIEKSQKLFSSAETGHQPVSAQKVRRTRGVTPTERSNTPTMKANGHDTSTSRVNGHGPVSPSSAAQDMEAPREKGRAASDDARDIPSAATASSAVAGKERDVCAEVAPPDESGTNGRSKSTRGGQRAGGATSHVPSEPQEPSARGKRAKDMVDIPPGSMPLPADGVGFVDAMHAHVDLYLACARLVKSGDEKIAQRMVERLLEMSYGKSPAPAGDDAPQIIFDAPRPIED
jgi:hypothetical protein